MADWRKLRKIEPYDPNAFDGDKDGIVQDGTAWERPAGVRIFDRAGQEIMPGRVSETPISGLVYRDQNGSILDYKPKFGRDKDQEQQKPGDGLGQTLEERRGTIGQDRTLGDKVRQQREREAARSEQERQLAEQQATTEAARQRRAQFANVIDNLPFIGPDQPDAYIDLDGNPESAEKAKQQAQFLFGMLHDALMVKSDPSTADRYGRIDPDRVDDQIERLNLATGAMFAMNIPEPINEGNASGRARMALDLLDALNGSIDEQNETLRFANMLNAARLDGTDGNISTEMLSRIHASLLKYAGFNKASTTAEQRSKNYDLYQAVYEKQLRNQYYKFLATGNNLDKINESVENARSLWHRKNRESAPETIDGIQGPLETLYPGIDLQPNDPSLGNTTTNNPNSQNPLPVPTNNGLNIDVDLEDLEPDSDVEKAVIVQAAIEHLRNGGSLSDIPNDYWGTVLELASSDAEIDLDNPFYEVTPSAGAISLTRIYWRRNADGTPSDQGWVTKAQPWQFSIADHIGFNIAAALGIYPEGSNWGGTIDTNPSDFNDWLDTMPVVVVPIAWNHVPTNGDLSRLEIDPSYRSDSVKHGAAKRHLGAILHTWLIGDEDRNPGNTLTGWMDGEAYVMPIDFGGSGGFADRKTLSDYMGIGETYGKHNKFPEDLQAHLATLPPDQRQKEIDDLIRTYDSMLQRAEQILRTNSEEEFIQTLMPQNDFNYPEMDPDMMRRELAAGYGGFENGTRLMRQNRDSNLRAILGAYYDNDAQENILFEISDDMPDMQSRQPYTQERLQKAEFQPKQNPPNAPLIGEKFAETTDATAEEIYDALDPIYDDLIEQEVKPDMKAVLKAVKENDIQELGRILTRSLGQAWNQSTTSKFSVILAHVARGEFEKRGIAMAPEFTKLPRNPETGEEVDAAEIISNHMLNDPEFSRSREIIGQLIMAQYDTTQDYLRDNGISEVRVYRGLYVLNSDERPFDVEAGSGSIETSHRTISSWGLNFEAADAFAVAKIEVDGEEPDTDGYGVILHNVVPAEEVFSIATTENYGPRKKTKRPEPRGMAEWENVGFGEPSEDEIILIGAQRPTDYIIKPNDTELSQEDLDNSLLNPEEDDFVFEISDDMAEFQPERRAYTPERLQSTLFTGTEGAPPGSRTVAKSLAETSSATLDELVEAIEVLDARRHADRPETVIREIIESENREKAFDLLAAHFGVEWNVSTTTPDSVFFAQVVREELQKRGIPLSEEYTKLWEGSQDTADVLKKSPGNLPKNARSKEILAEIINRMYEETQAYFKDKGITEIRAMRGMRFKRGTENIFEGMPETGEIESAQRTLNSWTYDLNQAKFFARQNITSDTSAFIHSIVPVEEVFAITTPDQRAAGSGQPFGSPGEREVVVIGSPRRSDYALIQGVDTDERVRSSDRYVVDSIEELDNILLNPTEDDFVSEISDDLPETPDTPQQTSLGNYTQQQLDNADYNLRPVDVVPPTTKSVAQQAAQNSNYSPAETAEALRLAGIFPKFEEEFPFKVQQAVENNDIETIYEQALEKIQGIWNGQVTEAIPEFFKDMVKEELQEAFGIEFGPDYARGDQTPGQRKLPEAYTPEAERGRQIIKQIANAHYQAVQQYLADQGITEVRIYRGLSTNTGEGTDFPETAGTKQLEMRPLSSWTTDYDVAATFTGYGAVKGEGVLLHQTVPAKYIFSIRPANSKLTPQNRQDAQGLGTTYESELIPIHTNLPYDYIVTGKQKLTKEEIDKILTGETTWTQPRQQQQPPPIPTQITTENYLNLTNTEMYNIDTESISPGMTIYNTDQNQFFVWTGKEWEPTNFDPNDIVG